MQSASAKRLVSEAPFAVYLGAHGPVPSNIEQVVDVAVNQRAYSTAISMTHKCRNGLHDHRHEHCLLSVDFSEHRAQRLMTMRHGLEVCVFLGSQWSLRWSRLAESGACTWTLKLAHSPKVLLPLKVPMTNIMYKIVHIQQDFSSQFLRGDALNK